MVCQLGPAITVLCFRLNKGGKTRDFREYLRPRFHGRERERELLMGTRLNVILVKKIYTKITVKNLTEPS